MQLNFNPHVSRGTCHGTPDLDTPKSNGLMVSEKKASRLRRAGISEIFLERCCKEGRCRAGSDFTGPPGVGEGSNLLQPKVHDPSIMPAYPERVQWQGRCVFAACSGLVVRISAAGAMIYRHIWDTYGLFGASVRYFV